MSLQQPLAQSVDLNKEQKRIASLKLLVGRLHTTNRVWVTILSVSAIIVSLLFLFFLLFIVFQGLGQIFNPSFYGTKTDSQIGPELFNSLYILILSEIFLIPIGLAAAIYLVEYAKQGPLVTTIHFAAETLTGVPSIVLGLFGYVAFGSFFGLGYSRLTGALTLLCLNLPLVLRLFEDALGTVPREMREGGLSLGATKWYVIRSVVLPSALPGIVTGIVLSAGKIIGEAAALIFTMGTSNPNNVFTLNPFVGSDNLTIRIWYVQTIGAGQIPGDVVNSVSAGGAALLIIMLLIINLAARGLGQLIYRRVTAS